MRIAAVAIIGCTLLASPAVAEDAPAPTARVVPVPTDFRLHDDRAPLAPAGPLDIVQGHLRHRFASAMMDLYPLAESGFHLSFGTRYYARRNFAAEAEKATNGLLYGPRSTGGVGVRSGFKRFTPAATIGYTATLAPRLHLGLESGARMGRAFASMPRAMRGFGPPRRIAAAGGAMGRTNPMVNLVLDYGF